MAASQIKHRITCDPAIPLLGIHPRQLKAGTCTDIYKPMFIATLLTIAKGESDPSVL